jgi:ADP-ribose pyrophosphatase YjhB (NUDIX family)
MADELVPRVGIGVIVLKDGKVLLGKRKGAHGAGEFASPAFAADWVSGEPEVREPDRIERWAWYDLADLPSPLFGTLPTALAALADDSRRCWDAP